MLTHTARNALRKLLLIVLAVLVIAPHRVLAANSLNLVVMVDLTASVSVRGHDGKTESEKNLEAVTRLLRQVPAGSHVTIIGITDNSFAQPYVLLSAEVGGDEGYFKERLAGARQQLIHNWQTKIGNLQVGFPHTDVLGALFLAAQVFHDLSGGRKDVLVIFSDMRHNTNDLNLETPVTLDFKGCLAKMEKRDMLASLQDVQVYVLGVDNAAKQVTYWKQLREFWFSYFGKAGAHVERYSVLRELTQLEP